MEVNQNLVNPFILSCALILLLLVVWKVLNWVWFRPKKLERWLRQQGLTGNSYRLLYGDSKEISGMVKKAASNPISISDDIGPRTFPFFHHAIKKHGKNPFIWMGPIPRVNLTDPELIREVVNNSGDFRKAILNPLSKSLAAGLVSYEGEQWAKHRKIINPAFYQEKLKNMLPAFYLSSSEMISKWEKMVLPEGSCELDVWPYLQNMSSDVISRTAFGSNYEEGKAIFQLHKELAALIMKIVHSVYIPGWRFLPTKTNKRLKKINRVVQSSLKCIIEKREKVMKEGGGARFDDLLGMLMESNYKEIQEHENNRSAGMSIKEVIEECKLFYFAGYESISALLVWTMIMLSVHPSWQERAREEVLQLFGKNQPNYDGLNHLKIVTMILNEALRLYPPTTMLTRMTHRMTKLGKLSLPEGVIVSFSTILVQRDYAIWGKDANEFKPERFSEGVAKATKGQVSFFPFGWGPRICIGQNFAMFEAKLALSMILQRFSFELSPSYIHAPAVRITLLPQYGAPIILHKI